MSPALAKDATKPPADAPNAGRQVAAAKALRWQEENSAAIHAYNRYIDRFGVPLAEFRPF